MSYIIGRLYRVSRALDAHCTKQKVNVLQLHWKISKNYSNYKILNCNLCNLNALLFWHLFWHCVEKFVILFLLQFLCQKQDYTLFIKYLLLSWYFLLLGSVLGILVNILAFPLTSSREYLRNTLSSINTNFVATTLISALKLGTSGLPSTSFLPQQYNYSSYVHYCRLFLSWRLVIHHGLKHHPYHLIFSFWFWIGFRYSKIDD